MQARCVPRIMRYCLNNALPLRPHAAESKLLPLRRILQAATNGSCEAFRRIRTTLAQNGCPAAVVIRTFCRDLQAATNGSCEAFRRIGTAPAQNGCSASVLIRTFRRNQRAFAPARMRSIPANKDAIPANKDVTTTPPGSSWRNPPGRWR